METKDIITIALSSAAFCFSIASFILSFKQKSMEGRYSLRKSLTDVVSEISNVNIAFAQLDIDHPNSADQKVVAFRRNYNDQRRYLAYHGAFLAEQIPDLVNDIDCLLIGGAFRASGNFDCAENYYNLAVSKSVNNSVKMNNIRALARYYFVQGNAALGRKYYQEALQLDIPDTDSVRQVVADTYMLWARVERDCGYEAESMRLKTLAADAAQRIGHGPLRNDTLQQIDIMFAGDRKEDGNTK
jgi:tetratricopeptide (TPR) repeat protein